MGGAVLAKWLGYAQNSWSLGKFPFLSLHHCGFKVCTLCNFSYSEKSNAKIEGILGLIASADDRV